MPTLSKWHLAELSSLEVRLTATYAWLEAHGHMPPAMAQQFRQVVLDTAHAQNLRGLRMVARDTLEMIAGLAPVDSEALEAATRAASGGTLGEALALDSASIDRILHRGRIRNDSEYHMLHSHLGVLENDVSQAERARQIAEVLSNYRTT